MSNKLVIYQTEDGKEIYRDWNVNFLPKKGMTVNFKETDKKLCNLMDWEMGLNYSVSEIIFLVPNVMLVSVKILKHG